MGQRLGIVSSPLGGCVSFTPFRLRSVASALSLPESWLFFLLWICRFTVGSSGAVPRGNFWGSREGWGLPVLSMVEFCLTFFLSFPGCSHPGLVGASSPGFDFTGLVAWSLLAPRRWKPPSQFTPFACSVVLWRWCGADDSLPLVSSLIAARFGLTNLEDFFHDMFSIYDKSRAVDILYLDFRKAFDKVPHKRLGLAIAALPLVSRPWTDLCWSHLLSLSSVGSVRGYTAPVGWLAQGCIPLLRLLPYF